MSELYTRHKLSLHAPGQNIVAALAAAVPGLSRRIARDAVRAGLLRVAGQVLLDPHHVLGDQTQPGVLDLSQGLRAGRVSDGKRAAGQPFDVLLHDKDVLVVSKAPGIASSPAHPGDKDHLGALVRQWLRAQGSGASFVGVVHRLDQDTSGCLVLALNRSAQTILGAQFAGDAATRSYRALVAPAPLHDRGTLSGALGHDRTGRRRVVDDDTVGKPAVTHYRVLRRFARGAELELTLETGRTHQIRIHLADLGCPVLGDKVYRLRDAGHGNQRGRQQQKAARGPAAHAPRLMLHAHQLAFDHPATGKRTTITAPVPALFAQVARSLD